MAKILDIQFDVNNQELLAFDEGKTIKFNVHQLREVKELFHRYDEATLIHNSEDEEEEFHYFCKSAKPNTSKKQIRGRLGTSYLVVVLFAQIPKSIIF